MNETSFISSNVSLRPPRRLYFDDETKTEIMQISRNEKDYETIFSQVQEKTFRQRWRVPLGIASGAGWRNSILGLELHRRRSFLDIAAEQGDI